MTEDPPKIIRKVVSSASFFSRLLIYFEANLNVKILNAALGILAATNRNCNRGPVNSHLWCIKFKDSIVAVRACASCCSIFAALLAATILITTKRKKSIVVIWQFEHSSFLISFLLSFLMFCKDCLFLAFKCVGYRKSDVFVN